MKPLPIVMISMSGSVEMTSASPKDFGVINTSFCEGYLFYSIVFKGSNLISKITEAG